MTEFQRIELNECLMILKKHILVSNCKKGWRIFNNDKTINEKVK